MLLPMIKTHDGVLNPIPGGLFWSFERRGGGGGFLARRDENAYKTSVTCSNHLKLGPCNHYATTYLIQLTT